MKIVTHASLEQIDDLVDVFNDPDGELMLPLWLSEWRDHLESENKQRWLPWPFSAIVEKCQTPRAEIIERQYAHLKDWPRSV